MKKTALLLVALLNVVFAPAQNISDSIAAYFKSLSLLPQEKLYLHIDKPYYCAGEKIWFKGYLLNSMSHQDMMAENFITIELLDRRDTVVFRKKIARDSIGFHNAFSLPADIAEGEYCLRGYSSWMNNTAPEFHYLRHIKIGNPIDRNVTVAQNYRIDDSSDKRIEVKFDDPVYTYSNTFYIPNRLKDFDVQFFPEGGTLLNGVLQKIAFKAQGSDGFSCEVTGKLFNAQGEQLGELHTVHDGMGFVSLQTDAADSYYAEFMTRDSIVRRFNLPKPQHQGFSLSLAERHGTLNYKVQMAPLTPQPRELYLVAHTRGLLLAVQPLSLEQPSGKFDISLLDDGITHFMLVDEKGDVLSERRYFRYIPKPGRWSVSVPEKKYEKRSPVVVSIDMKDASGVPLRGDFSVSITDAGSVGLDSLADNIISNLLLTSDLKGYVERPASYFQEPTPALRLRADLLMMTHGWRRHVFTNIAHWQDVKPRYLFENSQSLSGRVEGLFGGNTKRGSIYAISPKNKIHESAETDDSGRFLIPVSFRDSTRFLIQARNRHGFSTVGIILDPHPVPPVCKKIPYHSQAALLPESYSQSAREQYFSDGGMQVLNLKEVVVTGERTRPFESAFVGINDRSYSEMDLTKFGDMTLWDAILFLPEIGYDDESEIVVYQGGKPDFIIDGLHYPREQAEDLLDHYSSTDALEVSILRGQSTYYTLGHSRGAIIVATKDPSKRPERAKSGIITCMPLGYTEPVEFYHPTYATPEQRSSSSRDSRTTLYWSPSLQLDGKGCAEIKYYTSDNLSPHDITIEGITAEGKPLRIVERLMAVCNKVLNR